MGNDIFGVKWQNWKLNFKEMDAIMSEVRTYPTPRLYNLISDPQESENVLFPHTWVPRLALVQLEEHLASLNKHPPIKMGALDPYMPPK
jgi:arylsulfatase